METEERKTIICTPCRDTYPAPDGISLVGTAPERQCDYCHTTVTEWSIFRCAWEHHTDPEKIKAVKALWGEK